MSRIDLGQRRAAGDSLCVLECCRLRVTRRICKELPNGNFPTFPTWPTFPTLPTLRPRKAPTITCSANFHLARAPFHTLHWPLPSGCGVPVVAVSSTSHWPPLSPRAFGPHCLGALVCTLECTVERIVDCTSHTELHRGRRLALVRPVRFLRFALPLWLFASLPLWPTRFKKVQMSAAKRRPASKEEHQLHDFRS